MSKYIIELDDDIKYLIINGRAENRCYTLVRPVAELEVLNSDYINEHFADLQDEAYLKGLREGKKAFDLLDAERDSEYQRGLDDAWEAAKKVGHCKLWGDYTKDTGKPSVCAMDVLEHYTAAEAIAKLKAYEERQKADDDIKVGDVVKPCENAAYVKAPFVVTRVSDEHVWGVDADGSWSYWAINEVIKTDKHFDIDKILEEMRHES